jgi:hypothetical protein
MQPKWVLHDLFDDDPEPGESVRVPISSSDELRKELEALAVLEPRIVELETPDGKWVRIGIGGPLAGFAILEDVVLPLPGSPSELRTRIALAPTPAPCERVEFLCGQQPSQLRADALLPAKEVIKLVIDYFESGAFPDWLRWRES